MPSYVPVSRFPQVPPPPAEQQWWFTALVTAVNGLLFRVQSGTGSPEGVVTAPVGKLYLREDGGVGTTVFCDV